LPTLSLNGLLVSFFFSCVEVKSAPSQKSHESFRGTLATSLKDEIMLVLGSIPISIFNETKNKSTEKTEREMKIAQWRVLGNYISAKEHQRRRATTLCSLKSP
jgi:hypothetical protein